MKVVLFCPVREKPAVLSEALASHRSLEGISERWYLDDNEDQESSRLLRQEDAVFFEAPGLKPEYLIRDTHEWTAPLLDRMTIIRDEALEMLLESDADAIFTADADVILHPKTAAHLSGLGCPVVSEVFWSRWYGGCPWMPNVWDCGGYEFHSPESIFRLRAPGQYSVGGLGAVTCIHRKAIIAGARYRVNPLGFIGEDRHFCSNARDAGVPLVADSCYPSFHVYRETMLAEGSAWRNSGCDPGYFNRMWLDREWEAAVRSLAWQGSPVSC